jgi:hypothetical protein
MKTNRKFENGFLAFSHPNIVTLLVVLAMAAIMALVLPSSVHTAHAASFTVPSQNNDVVVVTCTNKVPDNVTESTNLGQALTPGADGKLALQMEFALHAAGTETCTFNWVSTSDGTNYATSSQWAVAMAANGTTKVRTNIVIDLGPRKKAKLLSIVCGNTTTADMTNILVTATK